MLTMLSKPSKISKLTEQIYKVEIQVSITKANLTTLKAKDLKFCNRLTEQQVTQLKQQQNFKIPSK